MDILTWLEEQWRKTRKYNPAAPLFEKTMKTDSQNMRRIGNALGWQGLEDEAAANSDKPERGLARAALTAGGILGGIFGGGALAGSGGSSTGMFATPATEQAVAQQAVQQALAEQAAQQAAMQSGGMFAQIPGVTSGSPQYAALLEQTANFGGAGADLTAQAAMPAVKDAYAAGNMGTMEYLGNVGKADLAGMNSPSVWADRFARNAGKIAGNYGKAQALSGMFAQPQPKQAMPVQRPVQQQSSEIETLIAKAKAGDPQAIEELKRRMKEMGVA